MLIMHKKHIHCCRCPDCYKWFELQNGLQNHCKTKHLNVLKCLVCDLVCLTPDKLEYHQSTHNQVKRFGCDRVYKCKHCITKGLHDPDIEGAESGLINHLISEHRMAGAYLCIYCHKLFVTEAKLSKHNKTCLKNHPDKHG